MPAEFYTQIPCFQGVLARASSVEIVRNPVWGVFSISGDRIHDVTTRPRARASADPRRRVAGELRRSTGALSTAATTRMADDLPWFRELSAEDRSWVGMILQAGVRGFVDWFEKGGESPAIATSVFGAAPRALAGVITLQQTVELVKLSIEVVESNVEDIVSADDAVEVHRAISRYAREVAFATAEVYAQAAEVRGAWDARLEALVVDAVLRARPTRPCCPAPARWAGRP